jgi:hypothetical protein
MFEDMCGGAARGVWCNCVKEFWMIGANENMSSGRRPGLHAAANR